MEIVYLGFLGFGFLSFEDEESVERCVAEHFVNLNGKQVRNLHFTVYNSIFHLQEPSAHSMQLHPTSFSMV